jgi:hypothetical protein
MINVNTTVQQATFYQLALDKMEGVCVLAEKRAATDTWTDLATIII